MKSGYTYKVHIIIVIMNVGLRDYSEIIIYLPQPVIMGRFCGLSFPIGLNNKKAIL